MKPLHTSITIEKVKPKSKKILTINPSGIYGKVKKLTLESEVSNEIFVSSVTVGGSPQISLYNASPQPPSPKLNSTEGGLIRMDNFNYWAGRFASNITHFSSPGLARELQITLVNASDKEREIKSLCHHESIDSVKNDVSENREELDILEHGLSLLPGESKTLRLKLSVYPYFRTHEFRIFSYFEKSFKDTEAFVSKIQIGNQIILDSEEPVTFSSLHNDGLFCKTKLPTFTFDEYQKGLKIKVHNMEKEVVWTHCSLIGESFNNEVDDLPAAPLFYVDKIRR